MGQAGNYLCSEMFEMILYIQAGAGMRICVGVGGCIFSFKGSALQENLNR